MSEYTVHNECDTYHISTVFQDRKEEEQDCHLWYETKDSSKSTDDTINYKTLYKITCTDCLKSAAYGILDCYYKYIICPVCYK